MWRAWAVLIWALLGSGCIEDAEPPLRIGSNVWPGYEPLYLARSLGYFDATPVRLVEYPSATEVSRALRNGAIEAAALTLDEVLAVAQYGVAVQVVLVMDASHGGDVVLGKPDIMELKDIRGRRVGVESSALGAYVLTQALQIAGLDDADITVVPLPVSGQEQLYRENYVDAVVTMEPMRTRLLKQGARLLFDSSQIPGEVVDVLAVRTEYLERHPRQIKDLLSRWFAALEYRAKKPDDSDRRMSRRLAISPEEVTPSFSGLRIPGVEDNRRLLGNHPPQLLAPAERLMRTLLEKKLLNRLVELPPLFTARYLPENTP